MFKGKIRFFIILAVLLFFIVFIPYYLFFTTKGSIFTVKLAISRYLKPKRVSIEKADGALARKLSLQNVELADIKNSPEGTVFKIQKLDISFSSLSQKGINLEFDNARLILPDSDPLLLNGSYEKGILDLKVETQQLNVEKILGLLYPGDKRFKKIKGGIAGANIKVKGSLEDLKLDGPFKIKDLSYERFILEESGGDLSLNLNKTSGKLKLNGDVSFSDFIAAAPDIHNSLLKVQKINLSFLDGDIENIKIDNGRLKIADLNPILIEGTYRKDILDFNLYADYISIREILDFFPGNKVLDDVSGSIRQVDVDTKGALLEPTLSGKFMLEKFVYKGFSMVNSPGILDLKLKNIKKDPQLYGTVDLKSGKISGSRSAVINLKPSRIFFDGDFKNPSFDFKGTSTVEKVKIDIALKGTIDKPDLKLSSEPPLSQERLLVMLATNKSWESVTQSLAEGKISPDLAKDFLDYFVLSGPADKLIQQFGLDGISLKYNGDEKGIGVMKQLFDNLSVEAEKGLKQEDETKPAGNREKPEDTILFKFKDQF